MVTSSTKCEIRKFQVAVVRRRERNAPVQLFLCKSKPMGCFHSRGQHLCKFIATKGSVCIRKEFNTHRIGLGHQHGRPFIALGHQNGKQSIAFFAVLVGVAVGSSRRASLGGGGGGGGDEGMNFKQIQKLPLEQSPFVKIHWKGFFKPSKTNISPVICVPPPGETRIPSDMCSPTSETHIPSDLCSSFQETRIPSDTCSPTWETHIPSDMCPPTRETRIPSDMCSPTWGNTYP